MMRLIFVVCFITLSSLAAADSVLVTGSNRGIGLELVTQYAADGWDVIATSRSPDDDNALHALANANSNVTIEALDVTIRYDPSVLVFEGARPGAMFSGSVPTPQLAFNDTGERVTAAVAVISGVVLVEGGAVFEADFRIRPGAPAGYVKLSSTPTRR